MSARCAEEKYEISLALAGNRIQNDSDIRKSHLFSEKQKRQIHVTAKLDDSTPGTELTVAQLVKKLFAF
jgi:hypothetical protein